MVTLPAVTKTFLHAGCGTKRKSGTTPGFNTEEWIELRLDIDPAVQPDIVGSITSMSGVPTASVDAVYSSHNIEHLYPHEVPVALAEFLRVLKEDGFLVVTCPDLKSVAALVAEDKLTLPAYQSGMGPITPLDMLYGHRASLSKGNLYMAHHCGFTAGVLSQTLRAAGFAAIATLARPAQFVLWSVACKRPRSADEMRALAARYFGQ